MCDRCPVLERENAELRTDFDLLDRKFKIACRQEQAAKTRLANELQKTREDDPHGPAARRLCKRWQKELGHPRAVVNERSDRFKAALEALRDHSEEELTEAILGAKKRPYSWEIKRGNGSFRRRMAYGTRDQRSDDLTTIFRSPESIERFRGYAQAPVPDERLVEVPARVLDEMASRVDQARWMAQQERVLADEQFRAAQAAYESLAAMQEGRPRLRVVA